MIEDDGDLRRLLRRGLEEEGFEVVLATRQGRGLAGRGREPDLLVVDIGLPDADGRDVVQAVRSRGVESPVLFLTARDQMVDRLAGFSAGGDDYLTKPFEFAELIARLRALLRRSAGTMPAVGRRPAARSRRPRGCLGRDTVPLTPTEFRLLGALVGRHGEAVRRRELIAAGWPDGAIVHDNTLDVYLGRLRRKLAKLPTKAEDRHRARRRIQAGMSRFSLRTRLTVLVGGRGGHHTRRTDGRLQPAPAFESQHGREPGPEARAPRQRSRGSASREGSCTSRRAPIPARRTPASGSTAGRRPSSAHPRRPSVQQPRRHAGRRAEDPCRGPKYGPAPAGRPRDAGRDAGRDGRLGHLPGAL